MGKGFALRGTSCATGHLTVQQSAAMLAVQIWRSGWGGSGARGSERFAKIQPANVMIFLEYSRRLIDNKPGLLGSRWRVVRDWMVPGH